MANPTTNYGFVLPTPTDLVTDLPADFDVALQGVDTQMLTNANAAIAKTIVDAKGDIIAATAADAVSRLAVGANDTVLTADSTTATGLKWAAAGGGKVLQVVAAYTNTQTSNSTSTYEDTTLTATITPTATSSKVLVLVAQNGIFKDGTNAGNAVNLRLLRGSTVLDIFGSYNMWTGLSANSIGDGAAFQHLDSPATTSATTYKTQFMNPQNTANVSVQKETPKSSIILMEIGA